MNPTKVVLVVDDEPANIVLIREMLEHYVEHWSVETLTARDGATAISILESDPRGIDAVLLDQRMPGMSGLDVLARMRTRSDLAAIPVILQTAVGGAEFEDEGLRAGAFYYLEKPYPGPLLASVLEEALHPNREPSPPSAPSERPARQVFHVRTLEDARAVATEIAELCPQPERAFLGLLELIVNAVEHGNLGISYAEKTALCAAGRWEGEIRRRLALPENTEKAVEVRFEHHSGESHIWIRDAGAGFNWPAYVATDAARAADPHGRGIALARTVSFDWLEYLGNGSEVHAVIHDVDPRSPGRSRGVGVAD